MSPAAPVHRTHLRPAGFEYPPRDHCWGLPWSPGHALTHAREIPRGVVRAHLPCPISPDAMRFELARGGDLRGWTCVQTSGDPDAVRTHARAIFDTSIGHPIEARHAAVDCVWLRTAAWLWAAGDAVADALEADAVVMPVWASRALHAVYVITAPGLSRAEARQLSRFVRHGLLRDVREVAAWLDGAVADEASLRRLERHAGLG